MHKGNPIEHFAEEQNYSLIMPFIEQMGSENVHTVKEIHVSRSCRSYEVCLGKGADLDTHHIILKAYQASELEEALSEMENLEWVQNKSKIHASHKVQIPEIVWSNPSEGLFATRWIEGEDFWVSLKRASRRWSKVDTSEMIEDITSLSKWLVDFNSIDFSPDREQEVWANAQGMWKQWLTWMESAEHLDGLWRDRVLSSLETISEWADEFRDQAGPIHGDFSHWNIRRDHWGNFWIIDWRRLEIGHWTESLFRFYYLLRLSGLSPLAKRSTNGEISHAIESFIEEGLKDKHLLLYSKSRSALRSMYFMCQRPPRNIKRIVIQNFWASTLGEILNDFS